MVFVVLSGLPLNVDPEYLAYKINAVFGKNKEIGTFRVNIDESDVRKPKAVLKFKQGFDAMEAQRLLESFMYQDPNNNMIYKVKAIVPVNNQPYISLFSEKEPDIADVIKAEKKKKEKKEKKARKRKHSIEKKMKREKSDGECSDGSKSPVSPEEPARKKPYDKISTTATCSSNRSPSSIPVRYSHNMREYNECYSRPHTPVTSPAAAGTRSLDVDEGRYTRCHPREERGATDRGGRNRSSSRRPNDDLRLKLQDRKALRESRPKEREYRSKPNLDSIYRRDRFRSPLERDRIKRTISLERDRFKPTKSLERDRVKRTKSSERDRVNSSSTNESDGTDLDVLKPNMAKPLLSCLRLLEPTHYLTEDDPLFKAAITNIINTVANDTERLSDEDRKLIIDNFTEILVHRVKNMKFTNLMSLQDVVLDYKIAYNTTDDKLLIYRLIKELQALGKGAMRPEIKQERLTKVLDELTTDIDEILGDIKPEIKTESTVEYAYEDGDTTEVINIVLNLVPVEKRDLPLETDPDKIAQVKVFVSKLKKTKPSRYFRPIRKLLNEMKLFIYKNATVVSSDVILNRMVEVLEKMLSRMLCPVQSRIKAREVCGLFRRAFPYSADRDFVDMIVRWILDGEFERGIDGLIIEKVPKIEKNPAPNNDNSTDKHSLPVPLPIKTEASNTDIPIKKENPNDYSYERTAATTKITINKEQKTDDVVIKAETNVGNSDDVIIKKEPLDVILIDDDCDEMDDCVMVTKKKPVNNKMTSKVKLEPISDLEDDGAESDDSRTTLVLDLKPDLHHIENDTVFGGNGEFTHIKNRGELDTPCMTELKTELDVTPPESGETTTESGVMPPCETLH